MRAVPIDVDGLIRSPYDVARLHLEAFWTQLGLGQLKEDASKGPHAFTVTRGYSAIGPEGRLTVRPQGNSTYVHLVGEIGIPIDLPGFAMKTFLKPVIEHFLDRALRDAERYLATEVTAPQPAVSQPQSHLQ